MTAEPDLAHRLQVAASLTSGSPEGATPPGASLAELLTWEAAVRRWPTVPELLYFLANESRDLVAYEQTFVLKRPPLGEGWQVEVASSLPAVDRNAPVIRAIEAAVRDEGSQPRQLRAPDDEDLAEYPFRLWAWIPLLDREGAAFAALLVAREAPFTRTEAMRLQRMAETTAHAWLALTADKPVRRLPRLNRRQRWMVAAAVALVALMPVHLSALAPVEVVAARPFVVTAPFQGVVRAVDVAPSAPVRRGQPLLQFDDVKLRNDLAVAQERLQVTRAKVEEVSTATFADATQSHGISIAQAEFKLAEAEFAAARDMLARARVASPIAGLAIYTDRREWEGRAVETGQPIMEVADPAQVRYRIDLPAKEQMRLSPGSPVTVWLDGQPLAARRARLADASYQARPTADGVLAFALDARPTDGPPPRIGSRGTARVSGSLAPLAYALLRRPIAGLRQSLGV